MTIRRAIRASAFVGGATFVVSILSFLKNLLAARMFGVSGTMDAFNIVISLPNLFAGVFLGALQASVVPVLVSYRETVGPWLADRFVALLVWRVVAIALAAGALYWLFGRWLLLLIGSGLSPADYHLARRLVPWAAALFPMNVVVAAKSCQLIARNDLVIVSFLPGISSLLAIALLFSARRLGMPVLVYSLVLGTALQLIVLFALTLEPRTDTSIAISPETQDKISVVPRTFFPLLFASSFGLTNAIVDQSFASPLGEGSVAALAYANALNGTLSQLSVFAAATVLLPTFSQIHSQERPRELTNAVRNVFEIGVMIFVPLTAAVLVLGRPLVWFLFGGGNFRPDSAELTSRAWLGYAVSLTPLFCGIVLTRFYHAIKRPTVLVWAGALSLIMNAGLDFSLSKLWGPLGIALSTSFTYVAVTALLIWHCSREFAPILSAEVLNTTGKAVLASSIAWGGMKIVTHSVDIYQLTKAELLVLLIVAAMLGAVLYWVSGVLFKVPFRLLGTTKGSTGGPAFDSSGLLVCGDLPLKGDSFEA